MNGITKVVLVLVVVGLVGGAAFLLLDDGGSGDVVMTELVNATPESRVVGSDAIAVQDRGTKSRLEVADSAVVAPDGTTDTSASAASERPELPQATLSGRVVDEVGRAVAGAKVRFLKPSDVRRQWTFGMGMTTPSEDLVEATTDFNGEFALGGGVEQIDADGPSWFRTAPTLVVTHPNYASELSECAGLAEGAYDAGTIVLAAGTRIVGRVVDEVGTAMKGARVTAGIEPENTGFSFMGVRQSSLLDSFNGVESGLDGRFTVTGLPAGDAWVTAMRDDRRAAVAAVETTVGLLADVGDLRLEPGAAIAGRVMNRDDKPIAGASVRVMNMVPRRITGSNSTAERRALSHEFSLRATTDEEGHFELPGLTPGSYTVYADAPGHATGQRANVATGSRDVRVVMSPLGAVLVKLRSQTSGELINGAEIQASTASFRSFRSQDDGDSGPQVYVGQDIARHAPEPVGEFQGRYLVTSAGPDGLDLSIRAPGFAVLEVEAPGPSEGGMVEFDVELVPEIVVRGRVTDIRGDPIDDATVALEKSADDWSDESDGRERRVRRMVRRTMRSGSDGIDADRITARTDSNGIYEILGATAGAWDLSAEAPGFARGTGDPLVLVDGQPVENADVSLEQGGTVYGLVTDADGGPVPSAQVVIARIADEPAADPNDVPFAMRSMFGGDDGDTRTVTADAVGRYRAEDLTPGEYDVSLAKGPGGLNVGGAMVFMSGAQGASANDVKVRTRVDAGGDVKVDLVKPRSAVVEGRVLAAGEPVEDASVTLMAASDDSDPRANAMRGLRRMMGGARTAKTDRFGYYVFEDVEVGPEGASYELSTKIAGAGLEETAEVDVLPGGTAQADLVFSGSTLRGRVVDADTGVGVGGLTITVAKAEEENSSVSARFAFSFQGGGGGMSMNLSGDESLLRTAPDGSFEVKFLDPHDYLVSTGASAYVRVDEGPFTVKEGETTDDVVLEVVRGASVEGLVRSISSGEPMPGMIVSLQPEDGGPQMGQTDEKGRYKFEGLAAGGYEVIVRGTNFGGDPIASSDVSVEAGEVKVLDLDADDSNIDSSGGSGSTVTIGIGG